MNELLTQIYGYLHGMWRYRWSALAVAWVIALIGWMIVFSIPNQYSAKAVVYADTSSIMKPLLKGLTPDSDVHDELNIMSRVLLSRDNLISVIRETDMDLSVQTPSDMDDLVSTLASSIYVKSKRGRGSNNIYEIGYTAGSPTHVHQVVSILLDTMIENTLNSTRTDTASAQKFIDKQIAGYELRLSASEQKLAEFKKSNVGYMPDEKGGYYARLQNAQDDVESTLSELNLAGKRLQELKKQLRGESPLMGDGSFQPAYMQKLQQYESQLVELLHQYTERYPDVLALKAKIAEIKANKSVKQDFTQNSGEGSEYNPVYQEMKVQLSKASVEVQILRAQLVEKRKKVKKLRGSIDIIPEVEAQLAKLNRDYGITKDRYSSLVQRRESASLAQSVGQSISNVTFRVIETPVIPTRPSGPKRLLLLIGAVLFALGVGLGWSYLRVMLQPTFIDVQQLGKITGLPVLGAVGLYLSPEHRMQRRIQLASFFLAAFLLIAASVGSLVFNHEGTALGKILISDARKIL